MTNSSRSSGLAGSTSAEPHSIDVVWVPTFTPSRTPLIGRPVGAAAAADVRHDRVRRSGLACFRIARSTARAGMCSARVRVLAVVFRRLQSPSAVHGVSAVEPAARRAAAHVRAAADGRRGRGCPAPLVYGERRNRIALHHQRYADDVVRVCGPARAAVRRAESRRRIRGRDRHRAALDVRFCARSRAHARVSRARGLHDRRRRAMCRSKPPCARTSTASGSKGSIREAVGAHWRATVAGTVIGGDERDFIGQYRRNSHVLATLRYSF